MFLRGKAALKISTYYQASSMERPRLLYRILCEEKINDDFPPIRCKIKKTYTQKKQPNTLCTQQSTSSRIYILHERALTQKTILWIWNTHMLCIPKRSTELVVVHVRFALPNAPQSCHLIWVFDHKFTIVSLPGNHPLVFLLLQQLQDEVPQLDLPGAWAWLWLIGPVWEGDAWGKAGK